MVIFGHADFGKLTIFKWVDDRYELIGKILVKCDGGYRMCPVTKLAYSPAGKLPYQFYGLVGSEFHCIKISRVLRDQTSEGERDGVFNTFHG